MWISVVFALGETYVTLLIARAIQGIGSACIGVCGMSLVAQVSNKYLCLFHWNTFRFNHARQLGYVAVI